jgi:hypothetical protein
MTIPMLVMIASFLLWLVLDNVRESRGGAPLNWAIDVCRIVFATSVLVVLWANMNQRVF